MVDGIQELVEVLQPNTSEPSKTYSAEISKIDNEGRVWVYLEGSSKETPTATSSAEVDVGDNVNVEWRNNKLYIAGNTTNPSAGVVRVRTVENVANVAKSMADTAIDDAARAKLAADTAEAEATNATNSARQASSSAQQAIESANTAGIAASVAQAAAEAAQGDIDEQKEWFWHDTNGAHILGATSGYRTDIDSTGLHIIENATQTPVSEFGLNNVRLGKANENNVHITDTRFEMNNEGNTVAYLEGERLKTGDAQITNLYMKTYNATDGSEVGALGWVMRSNGHLSLRRLK